LTKQWWESMSKYHNIYASAIRYMADLKLGRRSYT